MSARPSQLRAPRTRAKNPGLRLVRRRSRKLIHRGFSTKLAPMAIIATIGVVAVVIGVLLEQVVLAQSAFKLAKIRQQVVEAEAEHQELLLEATKLGSPGRIEKYAMEELGMVKPRAEEIDYVVADVKGLGDDSFVARARRANTLQPDASLGVGTAIGVEP
ncbi:MAG: cell division protein FtsL [Actinomycetota bacterium]|nr:cell division protein FtsL [Actinomycetota bacterium]